MNKISVTVPVYNVEKYLRECLDSLIFQTFKQKYEIICVDDGSTDSSKEILIEYKNKYPDKIKLIFQKNKGVSEARNTAMNYATGKYTMFVDSDDYIAENALEELYNYAEKHNSQAVVFDFFEGIRHQQKCQRQHYENIMQKYGDSSFNCKTAEPFVYRYIAVAVWCKFYLTDLVKNIKFVSGINNEDVCFWTEVFTKADRINYFPAAFYFHVINRENAITFEQSNKAFDLFKSFSLTEKILKDAGVFDKLKNIHYTHFASNIVFISGNIYPELRKQFTEIVKNIDFDVDYSAVENGDFFEFEKQHIRIVKFIRENDFESAQKLYKKLQLWN